MFIILKTGDMFEDCVEKLGNFEDWTIKAADLKRENVRVIYAKTDELPDFEGVRGIIITGSHDMVTDKEEYMIRSSEWLKNAAQKNVPIFGICFGHQLLGDIFGGTVANHPEGPEIGTVSVNLTIEAKTDPLFKELPDTFLAHATHTQSVIKLPENARLLAQNCYEPCHAFRIGDNIWGVQFHPEHTPEIIKAYILKQQESVDNLPIVLSEVCDTPYARKTLQNFVTFCNNKK